MHYYKTDSIKVLIRIRSYLHTVKKVVLLLSQVLSQEVKVEFVKIRKSLGLTQMEMAILFGISVASIRNWEQSTRLPENAGVTLYKLVQEKDQNVLVCLVRIACQKKYDELNDVLILKKLIHKVVQSTLLRSLLEITMMESNSHWKPEELGFRVTKIQF